MATIDVKVPDIGDFSNIPVIEVLVKPGDTVKADDPLLVLESDKATMEVPAPSGGVVQGISVKVGDKVSEGSVILTLAGEGAPLPPLPPPAARPPRPRPRRPRSGGEGRGRPRRRRRTPGSPPLALADFRRRARLPGRAPPGARTRDRPHQGEGHGRKGPRDQGGREGLPGRRRCAGPRCRRLRRLRHPGDPGRRLLEVRSRSRRSRWCASSASPARICTAPG